RRVPMRSLQRFGSWPQSRQPHGRNAGAERGRVLWTTLRWGTPFIAMWNSTDRWPRSAADGRFPGEGALQLGWGIWQEFAAIFRGGWANESRGNFLCCRRADLSRYFIRVDRSLGVGARSAARAQGSLILDRRRRQRGQLQPRRQ